EEGKRKGKLTYDEINKVLPSETAFPEELDKLLVLLSDLGIELVEESQESEKEEREGH
ncbi:MAG: RNA polymerase sigma factor region1.1 domain-containing protein, partial [Planctomycetota bacterium]